mmetsp:Transcript_11822/g.16022  ORF Transcript_11822/g.16022 Transcript_11822/m.16022 type:complete len:81 (+) Transcript_11822:1448-1690(+)
MMSDTGGLQELPLGVEVLDGLSTGGFVKFAKLFLRRAAHNQEIPNSVTKMQPCICIKITTFRHRYCRKVSMKVWIDDSIP